MRCNPLHILALVTAILLPATLRAQQEWVSCGICQYTDDFIGALFLNAGSQTYGVEVLESASTPHLYRLVNPYGAAYPLNSPGDYDTSTDHFLTIHAENPSLVYIEECTTGMNWLGYGEIRLSSKAWELMEQGRSPYEIDAALFGRHENDCITFPVDALLIAVPATNRGEWLPANRHGLFRLEIPGSGVDCIEADPETPIYYNILGNRVEKPGHGIYIRSYRGKSTKITL